MHKRKTNEQGIGSAAPASTEIQLSDDDAAVERLLSAFAPAPARLDRDRLMFLAGQAASLRPGTDMRQTAGIESTPRAFSRRSRAWFWPMAAAVMAAVSLSLAAILIMQPEEAPRIVYRNLLVPVDGHLPGPDSRPIDAVITSEEPSALEGPNIRAQAAGPHRPLDPIGPSPASLLAHRYFREREIALNLGPEALPTVAPRAGELAAAPLPQRQLLEELLPVEPARQRSWLSTGLFSWPSTEPEDHPL